jgi:hypothetical protein
MAEATLTIPGIICTDELLDVPAVCELYKLHVHTTQPCWHAANSSFVFFSVTISANHKLVVQPLCTGITMILV